MLNILFISSFPIEPISGGVQRVTHVLAGEFQKLGFSTYCLVLKKASNEIDYSIKHYFLPEKVLYSDVNKLFYSNLLEELDIQIIINQAGIYKVVVDFIANQNSHCCKVFTVHHNCIRCLRDNLKNIFLGSAYGKLLNIIGNKILWNILLLNNKRNYALNFRNAIEKSDKLVLLSEIYIEELKTYLDNWSLDKVKAIYNPLSFDIKRINLSIKENRMIYVGRVEFAQKQTHLLLPIWKEISKRYSDWHLDIVGDGSYLSRLRKDSVRHNLTNIHFHGQKDPKPFLEKAKVLLMTSSFEGYGMVLVEAQAFGVVPICFNSFSILSTILLNFEAGIGIKPFDLDEYVERLSFLINDDETRNKMILKGYGSASRFNPAKVAEDWVNLMKA